MERKRSSRTFTYALTAVVIATLFSGIFPLQNTFASHSDIVVEVSGTVFEQNDEVVIRGTIDNGDEDDQIDITIEEAGGGDESDEVDLDNDGDFSYVYDVSSSADDGLYEVEVVFENEDPVFTYFIVDEENNDIDVSTDNEAYELGDRVTISGTVDEDVLDSAVNEVEITILDPTRDDVLASRDVDIDNDGDFEYDDFRIDDSDEAHGRYAIIVSYDDDDGGWAVFDVEEDGGSNEITARLDETILAPDDEVTITGSVEETDVEPGEEVTLEVEFDDVIVYEDDVEPENDGAFLFEFDLDDLDEEAESGTYTVTLKYTGYEDKTLTFTVSTGSGGSGGSGSGSSSGLTARLSKTSLLAGEMLTVSGVVPSVKDEPVNISVLRPDGFFVVAAYPEPDSDRSYSATVRLPTSLDEDEDYSVVVSYDRKEVEVFFDITGVASGSTGGPVTVETDKASYASGSTVRISGEIASDTFVEGEQLTLQVFNPDNAPYRFDPITPESDGSYSYSMRVGGPLGVNGEWKVKVTYSGESAETTFDLTGGAPSSPRFNLIVGDLTFPIEYQSDGTVTNMFVRPADKELVIRLNSDDDGTLTIVLPRDVIDAVKGGSDIEYVVVVSDIDTGDEEVIEVSESSTDVDSRTLVIEYPRGTDLIEIQGTTVVPEFGVLAAIVLAVAILGTVAFTTRYPRKLGTTRFP